MSKAMIPNVTAMLKERITEEDKKLGDRLAELEGHRLAAEEREGELAQRYRDQAFKVEQMTIALKVLENWT